MNTVLKAIEERFSCRNYTDKVIEEKDISAIAQAAIQAPSGMNRQNWQVIVIKDKSIVEEMEAAGMKILTDMEDKTAYERIMSRGGKLFYNAPCMIVITVKEDASDMEWIDCGILAQNVVLAATSLGIATVHCGMAGMPLAGDKGAGLRGKLKFKEGYKFGLGVLLGYAADSGTAHVPDQEKITVIG